MQETVDERPGQGAIRIPSSCELALITYGPGGVRAVRLPREGGLLVGRDASCQLVLAGPTVSRLHARFSRRSDHVVVEDLGSRHGTWVSGERIERMELGLDATVSLSDVVVAVTRMTKPGSSPVAPGALLPEALYLSTHMQEIRALLHRAARTDLSVVVLGETGTGKELAARELHIASERAAGPLRVLNCAAIPPHLVESTLFGHERGAFTGADRMRPGIFEDTRGGTVFLDEIGELSLAAQAALLRAIDTHRVTRVGSTKEIDIDVRVVCATHRDLRAMVERGEFRADMLHRLCAIEVVIPPLRARVDEIRPLSLHFLAQAQGIKTITPEALALLEAYPWPGNIRELRNVIARTAALSLGPCITEADLPEHVRTRAALLPASVSPASLTSESRREDLRLQLKAVEQSEVERALARSAGNQRKAAAMLNLPLRTFERRLRALRNAQT